MAGNSVSSNAAFQAASSVSTMPPPPARPTLLTRMSRPPKCSTDRPTIAATPSAVDRSACTASTRSPPLSRRSFSAAAARRSAPRAQTITLQPSASSARADASPRPRLEPVTRAILSVSCRSIRVSSATSSSEPPVENPPWTARRRGRHLDLGSPWPDEEYGTKLIPSSVMLWRMVRAHDNSENCLSRRRSVFGDGRRDARARGVELRTSACGRPCGPRRRFSLTTSWR